MAWVSACSGSYQTVNPIVPQAFLLTHSLPTASGLVQDGESDQKRGLTRGQMLCRQEFLAGAGNQGIQGPMPWQWCESSKSTH